MLRLKAFWSTTRQRFLGSKRPQPSALLKWASMTVTLAALGLLSAPARADLSDCGEINVTASAQCEVVPPSAQCEAMCTPISVRAACSAQLAAECDASCDELPSIDCRGQCYASCEGQCQVDPGRFDCQAACGADCSGRCQASCGATDDRTGCEAECMGACGVSCRQSCEVELPEADCQASCEAGCEGSCKVETNIDCQVQCQADGFVDCEADVRGGCALSCRSQQGALFCDGQYIDPGENLQRCIEALRAINVRVEGESSGDAECRGGSCQVAGQARASSDCSATRPGSPSNLWALMALVAAMLAYMLRVRNPNA
jgi:hypothetical protein